MPDGPQNFTSVPVIDVRGLRDGSPDGPAEVAAALGRAAREVGFMYVTGTGIPPGLCADLLAVTERFFALPHETKMATYIGRSRNHRGYVPEGEEVFADGGKDHKEAFDLGRDLPADDPDYLAGNPMLGPNQWPDLPRFREVVSAYYAAVFDLGCQLLRGFALALGEPADFFDRHVTRPPSQLRLIHYPVDPGAEDRPGIGAHTDYECFTILLPTMPGLEVMNGAGEWIDAPPRPGAFVVNIGDTLEMWTNGALVATSHRVRKVSEERFSFPLFFSCDYEVEVAPLPQFVTAERPARYPPVKAGEHLYAQTLQSFTYLKERLSRGELSLPDTARPLSSFGQEGKVIHGRDVT
jgi:isopenicillin N synthase-like dioxygenase